MSRPHTASSRRSCCRSSSTTFTPTARPSPSPRSCTYHVKHFSCGPVTPFRSRLDLLAGTTPRSCPYSSSGLTSRSSAMGWPSTSATRSKAPGRAPPPPACGGRATRRESTRAGAWRGPAPSLPSQTLVARWQTFALGCPPAARSSWDFTPQGTPLSGRPRRGTYESSCR